MDLNGDGLTDLIQTADSSQDGGIVWSDQAGPYWRVWFNSGNGFLQNTPVGRCHLHTLTMASLRLLGPMANAISRRSI